MTAVYENIEKVYIYPVTINGIFSIVKRWRNSRNFTSIFSIACLFIPHPLMNLFYVFFRNGGSDTSPLYGRYCGNRIPRTIPSFSNQLLLFFRSDESRSARGFEVFWDGTSQGEFSSSKLIFDWNECQTVPYINNWNGKSSLF